MFLQPAVINVRAAAIEGKVQSQYLPLNSAVPKVCLRPETTCYSSPGNGPFYLSSRGGEEMFVMQLHGRREYIHVLHFTGPHSASNESRGVRHCAALHAHCCGIPRTPPGLLHQEEDPLKHLLSGIKSLSHSLQQRTG